MGSDNKKELYRQGVLCALARQNCIAMLETRGAFDSETVARICEFISTLCAGVDDGGCAAQSKTCREAASALRSGDTERYMELCRHACATCPFSVRAREEENRTLQ